MFAELSETHTHRILAALTREISIVCNKKVKNHAARCPKP
jgi:hypothetical protein